MPNDAGINRANSPMLLFDPTDYAQEIYSRLDQNLARNASHTARLAEKREGLLKSDAECGLVVAAGDPKATRTAKPSVKVASVSQNKDTKEEEPDFDSIGAATPRLSPNPAAFNPFSCSALSK